MSIPLPNNNLNGKWNLYYHLPHDNSWDLSSYNVILGDIDTAEKVISLNETIPEQIVKNCMLFLMRDGITPLWEDKQNRNGGCFSYKVINKQVHEVWKNLFYLACGESLTTNLNHYMHINGITISPKKNFCIIKIWLNTMDFQDSAFVTQIPYLAKQACLFKKHEPEF